MTGAVLNPRSFQTGLDKAVERFHERFRVKMRRTVTAAMLRLLRRTPVNTGRAVMNYVATAGEAYTGPVIAGFVPVEPTNKLPLGSEQLRGDAEAVARRTLDSVSYRNPYQRFFITNRAPHIAGLEAGELPDDPYVPRSPQGMFRVTLQEISAMMQAGKL